MFTATSSITTTSAFTKSYTFKVAKDADKLEIKKAIEEAFKVSVVSVNTLNTKSKRRRVGKYAGRTKTYKKAIVTLAEGSVIEI